MFAKLLIANRGEIACRIMRTARRMGIATVAVYSDADRDALHVGLADEAVRIGTAAAADSYLNIDALIDACRQTGAEAVHPGYGFVSENQNFALALQGVGLAFIGPPTAAIEAMGDKITSKEIARQARVPTIPGSVEAIPNAREAAEMAAEIGYPVMLKASAGGGGKGMRVANDEASCLQGFERAASEAESSFGDSRIFVEKYIDTPRHLEVPVLADRFGNTVYLGERECSIQRRHQKVIEEAPSPFVDEHMRETMGEQAVALAKAVQYESAGTVEFIVDADRNFYFLEMNTRLQVEHPVTEFISGIDLVEWMIRVANGEKLGFGQNDIELKGWSVEARVYAEDPERQFLPSSGRLIRYQPPLEEPDIRVDSGVSEGGEIAIFYDPMIAKVITYGTDRTAAIETMLEALDEYYIDGVSNNIAFLQSVLDHPRFRRGDLTTDFIADEYGEQFDPSASGAGSAVPLVLAAAIVNRLYLDRAAKINGQLPGHEKSVAADWVVIAAGATYPVPLTRIEGGYSAAHAGHSYEIATDWEFGQPILHITIDDKPLTLQIRRRRLVYALAHRGMRIEAMVLSPLAASLNTYMLDKPAVDLSKVVRSPMPGLLLRLAVEVGQEVKAGEELAVVEALKMEHVLYAEHDA